METRWMKAAGRDGIPSAFIVDRSGVLAWVGHPAQIDAPLEKIVNDRWDLDDAKMAHASAAARERVERDAMARFEQVAEHEIGAHIAATESGDLELIVSTSSALIAMQPPASIGRNLVGTTVHRLLTANKPQAAARFIGKHRHVLRDDRSELVKYGRAIVHDDLFAGSRDADLAISLLTRACEIEAYEDSGMLNLLAQAHLLKVTQILKKAADIP